MNNKKNSMNSLFTKLFADPFTIISTTSRVFSKSENVLEDSASIALIANREL